MPKELKGRNRPMSSPGASLNTLNYTAILTLTLMVFQSFLALYRCHLPALTRRLHPAYSVIEEFVEGFF
jgi:hypothetical protein